MKKIVVLIALSLVFVFQAKSQYCMKISADSVRIKYALLNTDSTFGKTDEEILFDLLDLAFPNQFQPTDTFFSPDHTISYVKYIQLYSGYLVENSSVILAKRNDSIFRFSGYYVPVRNLTVNPKNSLEKALIVYDTFYSITDSSTNYYYELVVTEDTTPTP